MSEQQQQTIEEFFNVLRSIERKWQIRWEKEDIFEGKVDKKKQKYFVTVPYPYASGALHVGHARTYTLGDLFCRLKRQQGLNTLWPMAFHITGTPILSVSAKIEAGNKKTIDLYSEYVRVYEADSKKVTQIVESFTDPMKLAMYFSQNMIKDFKSMGYSIDTHRQFTTGDPEYNKFIEWQYDHLIKKNLVVQGEYPILWCKNDQNAVGEDDIRDADVEKVEVQEFIGLKFAMENNEFLVAGTFRPETIYGATNIWLHPNAVYNRVKVDEEIWIVSPQAVEKLKFQNHKIEVIEEFRGSELVGKDAYAPRVPNRQLPILPATFVDPDHATGVVYSVPAHAPYDYIALQDLQKDPSPLAPYKGLEERVNKLKPIALISIDSFGEFPAVEIVERLGVKDQNDVEKLEKATQEIYSAEFYNGIMMDFTEEFAGNKVEQAKDNVANALKKEGRAASFYESSRKAVCRCGEEIIVAVLPNQYFLNYGDKDWKSKAKKALDQMEIIPEKYRRLFESTFDWLDRRPCVRKRGLGTEFPLTKGQGWIIESLSDSVIYMAYYTIIRYINDHEIKPVQLTPAVFDYVFLGEGNLDKIEKDTKIEKKILKSMHTEFEYWYPNDLRHTAIAHISNHLSFAIFHHAAIFPERHWLKKITLNELLIREGEKMSKSGGNTIPIAYLPKQYSVDVTRLYLASAGSSDTVLNWTEEGIKTLVSRLRKFWTVASSIIDTQPLKSLELDNTSFMTRAFVSACTQHLNNAVKELESYDGRSYIANGFHFMLREVEFYLKTSIGLSEEEKNFALGSIIDPWVTVLCPVIPHICEDLNEKLGNLGFCSLKNMPSFESPVVGIDLSKQISFVNNTVDDIKSIIELKRAAPSSISIFFASEWKQELFEAISDIIGEGAFSIGKVMGQLKKNSKFTPKMKNIAKELKNIKDESKVFRQKFLGPQKELEAIEGYKTYLASLFNCPVNAFIAESGKFDDPLNRAQRAQPNKPAIYIKF